MAQIKIDGQALRSWLLDTGRTQRELGERLGRSAGYAGNCITRNSMSVNAYQLMLDSYNLDTGSFLPKPKPITPPVEENGSCDELYSVSLQVKREKVRVGVNFQGCEIYHAWSKIKGQEEVDLLQAISYAAHLIYKFAQQDELEK